jgi:hypothetical protein
MAVRFVKGAAQQGGQTVEMKSCFHVFLFPAQRKPTAKAVLSKVRIVFDIQRTVHRNIFL